MAIDTENKVRSTHGYSGIGTTYPLPYVGGPVKADVVHMAWLYQEVNVNEPVISTTDKSVRGIGTVRKFSTMGRGMR